MNTTNTITRALLAGIVCAAALLVSVVAGGCARAGGSTPDTVQVSATGTVMAQPDAVQMTIYYSNTAPSTKEAKDAVDARMREITAILKDSGVEEKDIRTVALNYREEIEYHNGRPISAGQRAEQSLAVTVHDIVNNPARFSGLLDKLSALDRVTINNIRFDIANKTEFFAQSRELAFQKAREKAAQYAVLSGRSLGGVRALVEDRGRDAVFVRAQSNTAKAAVAYDAAAGVPSGEQEITTDVTVTFTLK
ncbi:MAG: SIMPL domain-containing protein [Spirochaetaceae bacterium]|jgi:uncharacterized protein YggE|nr:SIMPL domain-containing protein [Spirochaetaceae bacterium]